MRSFARFRADLPHNLLLWSFAVAVLSLGRFCLVAVFRGRIDPSLPLGQFFDAFFRGIRYDSQVATYFALPGLVGSVLCAFGDHRALAVRLRRGAALTFVWLTPFLVAIDLRYFKEYEDQFNHFIFGFYRDDTRAILATIWKQYRPVPTLLAVAGAALLLTCALRWIVRRSVPGPAPAPSRWPRSAQALTFLLLPVVILGAARGSFGRRPMQQKDMAVTQDEVLNRCVYNPYTAIRYAVKDSLRLKHAQGIEFFIPDGDIRAALRRATGQTADRPTLDDYILKTAPGPRGRIPRHIFLIVLESYDAWPLLDRWRVLGVAERARGLGQQGIHFERFLPDGGGTIESLTALITGLPDAGIATNYQFRAQKPFPTSIAPIMKRLGYRTRFFYSGFLSWQQLDRLLPAQGFDEVFGGPHMGAQPGGNEWGVEDEQLFRFSAETIKDDRPSFNVLLTTSNHPPFSVDVRAKGFPLQQLPPTVAGLFDGRLDLNTLGHFWYQDHELGNFIDAVGPKLPGSLVAITGDHFSRRYPNGRPTLFEKAAVPLILWGPEVLAGIAVPPNATGSHIDIIPTLVNLAAPAGFVYHAAGHDLLDPAAPQIGFGPQRVITPQSIAEVGDTQRFEPLPNQPPPARPPDLAALRQRHNSLRALAWWRVMKGADLP